MDSHRLLQVPLSFEILLLAPGSRNLGQVQLEPSGQSPAMEITPIKTRAKSWPACLHKLIPKVPGFLVARPVSPPAFIPFTLVVLDGKCRILKELLSSCFGAFGSTWLIPLLQWQSHFKQWIDWNWKFPFNKFSSSSSTPSCSGICGIWSEDRSLIFPPPRPFLQGDPFSSYLYFTLITVT